MKNCAHFIIILFVVFSSNLLWSQSITWGPATPAGTSNELEVYNGSSAATFEFTNDAQAMADVTVEVNILPPSCLFIIKGLFL